MKDKEIGKKGGNNGSNGKNWGKGGNNGSNGKKPQKVFSRAAADSIRQLKMLFTINMNFNEGDGNKIFD